MISRFALFLLMFLAPALALAQMSSESFRVDEAAVGISETSGGTSTNFTLSEDPGDQYIYGESAEEVDSTSSGGGGDRFRPDDDEATTSMSESEVDLPEEDGTVPIQSGMDALTNETDSENSDRQLLQYGSEVDGIEEPAFKLFKAESLENVFGIFNLIDYLRSTWYLWLFFLVLFIYFVRRAHDHRK